MPITGQGPPHRTLDLPQVLTPMTPDPQRAARGTTKGKPMALRVSSPQWKRGETIPKKYTGDGADVSPPLVFEGVPAGTEVVRVDLR